MKVLKRVFTCVILLLASYQNFASKIGVKRIDNFNVLYFENDSMILNNQYFYLSPDSQTCVILDKESNEFIIFNSHMDEIRKIKYNRTSEQVVKVSNDQRYITYGRYSYSENLRLECRMKMYSNQGELIKDTILNPGLCAEFINNNDLVILNAKLKLGSIGSKNEIDTRLLIFNSNFELIVDKMINFYSEVFLRPTYDVASDEYLFYLSMPEDGIYKKTTLSIKK